MILKNLVLQRSKVEKVHEQVRYQRSMEANKWLMYDQNLIINPKAFDSPVLGQADLIAVRIWIANALGVL